MYACALYLMEDALNMMPHMQHPDLNNKSPTLMAMNSGMADQQQAKKKTTGPIHNPRYKSILCDHWERNNGTCPYAEKCQFAHGPAELAKWQAHRARQQQQQPQPQPIVQAQQQQSQMVHPGMFASPLKQQQVLQSQQYPVGIPSSHQTMNGSAYAVAPTPQYQHPHMQQNGGKMILSTTPVKPGDVYGTYSTQDLYAAYQSAGNLASPPQLYQAQAPAMSISPSQSMQNGMFTALPPTHHYVPQVPPGYAYSNSAQPQKSQPVAIPSSSNQRAPSPVLYAAAGQEAGLYMRQQARQTPAGSLSSTPPGTSPFNMMGYSQQHHPRRSISPDNQSLDIHSHHDMLDVPVPRLASDPRRTASLPQLFSKDFLASLSNEGGMPQHPQQQQQQQQPNSRNGMNANYGGESTGLTVDTYLASRMNGNNHQVNSAQLPPPNQALPNYSGYRRGSAPPVVLSVVTNSLGDYNSLADLDSLADELVSEPATASASRASQLFNMPTVFPGSIQGSINEYL